MEYGLTSTGFNKKPFDIILAEKKEQLNNAIGPIILRPDNIVTVILSIESESEALIYEDAEATINSFYRATATGSSLDGVSANIGLTRLGATPTIVNAVLKGDNQTVIPAGSEATALGVNTTFVLREDVLLTNSACGDATISVSDLSLTNFSVNINGTISTYIKQNDDSIADVVNGLVDQITANNNDVYASNEEDNLVIVDVLFADKHTFTLAIDDGLSIESITTYGIFVARDKGDIAVPLGGLTTIQTPLAGWVGVSNLEEGLTGRNLETDVEFRARGDISLSLPGAGTLNAVRARVLNVQGVTSASIDENDTLETNSNGTPAKSFQVLVVGGNDEDVAKAIYDSKPAGIPSYGNTYITVENFEITPVMIGFSRPVPLYIFVNVTYSLVANSNFPIDGDEQIATNIAKKINALGIGEDVIIQNLYCAIYDVKGISTANIQLGSSLDPDDNAVVYGNNNIAVTGSQVATTDINKIQVGEL